MKHNKLYSANSHIRVTIVSACCLLLALVFLPPPTAASTAIQSGHLTWDPNTDATLSGYRVYRSTQPGVYPSAAISGTTLLLTPAYTDSTAIAGTIYYYVVRAVGKDGIESTSSNEVQGFTAAVPPAAVNLAPTVNAGADRSVQLSAITTLLAVASDDGLPAGSTITYDWSVVSGTGVTFANAKLASTRVTMTKAGAYTLRVKVSDGLLSSFDDVLITATTGVPAPVTSVPPTVTNLPPTVSMTSPGAGSTLSGTSVTVSATAADDVSVAGVQFRLDGVALGAEDTTAPYSIVWSTKSSSDGPHTLTAVARDNLGIKTTSNGLSVTVGNADQLLTMSLAGSGSGSVISNPAGVSCGTSCSITVGAGQAVAFTATPDDASVFGGWSGDADCVDGNVTMATARNCVARFDLPQSDSTSLRGDFDGDGKTDIAVFRPSTGEWFIRLSSANFASGAPNSYFQWGTLGDIPVVGDFDGDRKSDLAVFRPSTGGWYLLFSGQNYNQQAANNFYEWGLHGDVPLSGDFDGDRKADIAVYRPSTGDWYFRLSSQNYVSSLGNWHFQLGTAGDVPVAGDFDGDSITDIGIYRPSTGDWILGLSSKAYATGAANSQFKWGTTGDQPLAGDFDGDGKTDIAVYRPSTGEWYFRLSTQAYATDVQSLFFVWGLAGDIPIVGDFDGDRRADITAFRPSTGEWFLRESSLGYNFNDATTRFQWGSSSDLPLPR